MNKLGSIDKNNKIPYYLQIKEEIIKAINNNAIKCEEKIENEHELSELFGVSRPTIRQALKELELEGLIVRKKGKGTFVAKRIIYTTLMHDFGIFDEGLGELNVDFVVKILKKKVITPSKEISSILKLDKNEKVNCIERLRLIGKTPFNFSISYTPNRLFNNMINEDLLNLTSPYLIEKKYNCYIAKIKRHLEPVNYLFSKRTTKILGIKENECYYYLQTFYYGKDFTPLAYVKGHFSSKNSKFTFYLDR